MKTAACKRFFLCSNYQRRLMIFMIVCFSFFKVNAQKKGTVHDSISRDTTVREKVEKDTTAKDSIIFKDIKEFSKKSKFTEKLHDLIFKDKEDRERSDDEDDDPPPAMGFDEHEDKIIRKVVINAKDHYDYSLKDEDKEPRSWAQKTGNAVHSSTKNFAIRKFFLFKKGEKVDTVLLNETARLLREQNYVRDVKLVPVPLDDDSDSLDIEVQVLDSWSLIPRVEVGGSKAKFGILERNFLGFGHRVDLRYGKRYSDGSSAYETSYTIPNFNNSFIDITLNYEADFDNFFDRYFAIQRDFYSP